MKSRVARFGVLFVAIAALMATMIPTASASSIKVVTFTGTANLSDCPGFGYPGAPPDFKLPNPTVEAKVGPKGEPQLNVNPGGNHCNFALSTLFCLKTGAGKKLQAADPCTVTVVGIIWGFCGFSYGTGFAEIVSPHKETTSGNAKYTGVGGLISVAGGDMNTNFYGEAQAVPPMPTITPGSCTNKSARNATIVGEFVIKDCTNGTTAGVCNP